MICPEAQIRSLPGGGTQQVILSDRNNNLFLYIWGHLTNFCSSFTWCISILQACSSFTDTLKWQQKLQNLYSFPQKPKKSLCRSPTCQQWGTCLVSKWDSETHPRSQDRGVWVTHEAPSHRDSDPAHVAPSPSSSDLRCTESQRRRGSLLGRDNFSLRCLSRTMKTKVPICLMKWTKM